MLEHFGKAFVAEKGQFAVGASQIVGKGWHPLQGDNHENCHANS